nr:MAG TPA: hypothetical protein [Caudoviricetes sp.]
MCNTIIEHIVIAAVFFRFNIYLICLCKKNSINLFGDTEIAAASIFYAKQINTLWKKKRCQMLFP